MSIWVEVQRVHDCWDPTDHPYWRRWVAGTATVDETRRYAAAHATLLSALTTGADRLAVGLGSEDLATAAAADRVLARRWAALGAPARTASEHRRADECAAVWSGAEVGGGSVAGLLVLRAVAGLRVAVAARALGAPAQREVRPDDGRAVLVEEARCATRLAGIAGDLARGAAPLLSAGAISHAEAALSAYWDLLDELCGAGDGAPALVAA